MTGRAVAGRVLIVATVVLALVMSGCGSKQTPPATTPPATSTASATTPPATTPNQQSVVVNLVAQNMAFDTKQISVPAGTAVTVVFKNNDSGIPHNFAVYQKLSGSQIKAVFVGDTITGSATITYHFVAPAAGGDYFFECDVHPSMNGTFTVAP